MSSLSSSELDLELESLLSLFIIILHDSPATGFAVDARFVEGLEASSSSSSAITCGGRQDEQEGDSSSLIEAEEQEDSSSLVEADTLSLPVL